jgi:heat shock protein HslJ
MKLLTGIVILLIVCSSCKQTETEAELFARPDFETKDIETDLFGKWYLIEITDSESNSTYYPPVDRQPTITFYNNPNQTEWAFDGYEFDFPFEANVANTFMSSFNAANDSVTISEGKQTVVLSEKSHWMQFEKLFFSALFEKSYETQIIKNILTLKNENKELLFYK